MGDLAVFSSATARHSSFTRHALAQHWRGSLGPCRATRTTPIIIRPTTTPICGKKTNLLIFKTNFIVIHAHKKKQTHLHLFLTTKYQPGWIGGAFVDSLRVFFTCILLDNFSNVICPVDRSMIRTHSLVYGLWEPLNTVCCTPAPSRCGTVTVT